MKLNSFRYYLKQGFKGVTSNSLMSIASIGTTVATLFILGIFIAMSSNINYIVQQVSRGCQIQVFINKGYNQQQYIEVGNKIKEIDGVIEVDPYTKEQTFQEVKTKFKDKATVLDGLQNDNPFRDSYKISLSDLNATNQVTEKLKSIEGIENIANFQDAADIIVKVSRVIKNVSLWIVIVLCVIAAFIISNTIKVSVFARRQEINIMKYIGATDWFIRWPFVIEGVIIGIFGALISLLVVWLVYNRLYTGFNYQFMQLLTFDSLVGIVSAAFFTVGVVIGAVGSMMSIRKHLKV